LADFQNQLAEFEQREILVVGGSTDPLKEAQKTVQECKLTFPLSYGIDKIAFAAATGAYHHADHNFLHATGFIIRPDRTIALAVYSTGPIGRFTPTECLSMIAHWTEQQS
jgi:peroxiredoxin